MLYGSHVFDFHNDIEAAIPFLSDLTPSARAAVKRVNIMQRALPYIKDFDNCEWKNLCNYLSTNLNLVELGLGVQAGRAARYEIKEAYEETDFGWISKFEGMEWMKHVAQIKGLKTLDVKAHIQHCPPPMSSAMEFFVTFSASIESGFADYLRKAMVMPSA